MLAVVEEEEESDKLPKKELKALCTKWKKASREKSLEKGDFFQSKKKLGKLLKEIAAIKAGKYVIKQ